MSDADKLRLVEWGLRVFQVSLILLAPKLMFQTQPKSLQRDSTLFGVRVPPDFSDSPIGRGIFDSYRKRIWLAAVAAAAIFALAVPLAPGASGFWYFGAYIGLSLAGWLFYALSQRSVRKTAGFSPPPSVRTASLFEDQPPEPALSAIAAWAAMVLPVALPLFAGLVARFHHTASRTLSALLYAGVFGTMMSVLEYALRYHARSSDWAGNPAASLKYRTNLAVMMGSAALASILWISVMTLGQIYTWGMGLQFAISIAGMIGLVVLSRRLRTGLEREYDARSGDPMPDACWKWGYFYYNPGDPAWVVPTRSGIGCSFNHAQPAPWVCYAAAVAAFLFAVPSILVSLRL